MLFNCIPSLIATKATAGLNTYHKNYYKTHNCLPLTPDKPTPKPLIVTFHQQPDIHGKKVNTRTYDMKDGGVKVGIRISKVPMGNQGSIDSIQLFLSTDLLNTRSQSLGTGTSTTVMRCRTTTKSDASDSESLTTTIIGSSRS